MNKRQFWYALLIWVGLLALGARWALNPSYWSEKGENSRATPEQVEKAFPLHIIDVSRSDLLNYSDRISNEDLEENKAFAAWDWCLRETQTRFVVLFFIWMISGFFAHWFLGRIVRGQKSYDD